MKIIACYISLTLLLIMALYSCKSTKYLERKQYSTELSHVSRDMVKQQQEANYNAVRARLEQDSIKETLSLAEAKKSIFDPANFQIDENGKLVAAIQAKTVSVISQTRVLAEREGKVEIDFIIRMPKELQGSAQSVVITPMLHRKDTTIKLEPLQVRGGLFHLLQERGYWRYGKFRSWLLNARSGKLSAADSAQLKWVFEQYVNHPYLTQTRFDSITSKSETIAYYYTQTVKVEEAERKIQLTLSGEVNALDGSQYHIPPRDTINFNISTMLYFVDTATRYKIKILEKFAVVNDRNYLSFKVNDSKIIDSLGDNKAQIGRIKQMMDQMMLQRDFYIDTITLSAAASPEGSARLNERLSAARAESLKGYLKELYRKEAPELDTMLKVKTVGENWPEFRRMIANDEHFLDTKRLLRIIDNEPNLDTREARIKSALTLPEYKHMRDSIYPLLRTVDFKYNLRRIGMLKDTLHTNVVDTQYMNAVEDLKARRYGQAATVLLDYKDLNAAIVMLSLGYNTAAYELLNELPDVAMIFYLRAIICARLGKFDEGLKNYKKSCDMDEAWEFRGRLDPEISALLINDEKKR